MISERCSVDVAWHLRGALLWNVSQALAVVP